MLIEQQLRRIKNVRTVPESSIEFALRDLGLTNAQAFTPEQARKIGQAVEARCVAWGAYSVKEGEWTLSLQTINPATGKASGPITATSADCCEIVSRTYNLLLRELRIAPAALNQKGTDRRLTTSPHALELLSRARFQIKTGAAIPDIVTNLRRAVSIDPEFRMAQEALAFFLVLENERDDALQVAKKAVQLGPDSAGAHSVIGTVYSSLGLWSLAKDELLEAIRLDPCASGAYIRLGEVYFHQEKWGEAAAILKKAETLAPYDALIHGYLGYTLQHMGQREKALAELELAERTNSGADPGVDEVVAQAFQGLEEPLKAIDRYTRFIKTAMDRGLNMESVKEAQVQLDQLQARLVPNPIEGTLPKEPSPEDLQETFRSALTANERSLVINPLLCSPKMKKWAHHLVGPPSTPVERAKNLFHRLTENINVDESPRRRTAEEAFRDWRYHKGVMNCQDYAFLYVALARAIGLKSCCAYVALDCSGRPVSHVCAAVSVSGTNFLVDPAYDWFGVPHRRYKLKDDLSAIAAYLAESDETAKEDAGLKLVPDWAAPHVWVAINRLRRGDCNAARKPLQTGLLLEPGDWLALYAQGTLEMCDGDMDSAIDHLRTCLTLNPDWSLAHFSLGTCLGRQGALIEARDELRAYLAARNDPGLAPQAREAITYIDQKLADAQEDWK